MPIYGNPELACVAALHDLLCVPLGNPGSLLWPETSEVVHAFVFGGANTSHIPFLFSIVHRAQTVIGVRARCGRPQYVIAFGGEKKIETDNINKYMLWWKNRFPNNERDREEKRMPPRRTIHRAGSKTFIPNMYTELNGL